MSGGDRHSNADTDDGQLQTARGQAATSFRRATVVSQSSASNDGRSTSMPTDKTFRRRLHSALPLAAVAATADVTLLSSSWKLLGRDTQWQWQLVDDGPDIIPTVNSIQNVTVYDIDMDTAGSNPSIMARLRASQPGTQIICYISVGTYEPYPDRVAADLRHGIQPSDWNGLTGHSYGGQFSEEKWLDVRSPKVKDIMTKRFDYAQSIGCDGIEPDNQGANSEDTGFPITAAQSIAYSSWVAAAVHTRGMNVGLKNSIDLIGNLVKEFDWFLNENCNAYDECGSYSQLVPSTKPVFGVEYCDLGGGDTQDPGCYCPEMNKAGFQWLIKDVVLNAARVTCQDYCQLHPCPGRVPGKSCKASTDNVCKASLLSSQVDGNGNSDSNTVEHAAACSYLLSASVIILGIFLLY